jgi:hypothetical protein
MRARQSRSSLCLNASSSKYFFRIQFASFCSTSLYHAFPFPSFVPTYLSISFFILPFLSICLQIIKIERLAMPPPEQRIRATQMLDVMEIEYAAQVIYDSSVCCVLMY